MPGERGPPGERALRSPFRLDINRIKVRRALGTPLLGENGTSALATTPTKGTPYQP